MSTEFDKCPHKSYCENHMKDIVDMQGRKIEELSGVVASLNGMTSKHDVSIAVVSSEIHAIKDQVKRSSDDMKASHKISMSAFKDMHDELREHMRMEASTLREVVGPIHESMKLMQRDIGGLYTRWWTVSGGIMLVLLSVVGYLYADNQAMYKSIATPVAVTQPIGANNGPNR